MLVSFPVLPSSRLVAAPSSLRQLLFESRQLLQVWLLSLGFWCGPWWILCPRKKETFAIIGLGFDLCTVFGLVGIRWTPSNSILSTSRWEMFISFVRKRLRVSSVSLGDSSWLSFMPKNLILLRRVKHSRFIWRLSSWPKEASFFFASFNSADIDLAVPCSSFTLFWVNCKLSSSCAIFSFCRSNSGSNKSTLSNFSSICCNLLPHSAVSSHDDCCLL